MCCVLCVVCCVLCKRLKIEDLWLHSTILKGAANGAVYNTQHLSLNTVCLPSSKKSFQVIIFKFYIGRIAASCTIGLQAGKQIINQ